MENSELTSVASSNYNEPVNVDDMVKTRSEERRVGKEWRSRWSPEH